MLGRWTCLLAFLCILHTCCCAAQSSAERRRRPTRLAFIGGGTRRRGRSQYADTPLQDVLPDRDDSGYLPPVKNTIDVPCGISVPPRRDQPRDKESVHLGEYPWMALLGYSTKKHPGRTYYNCGGSLVNERYVLTAAHCVSRLPRGISVTSVRLGEYNTTSVDDCITESGVRVCTAGTQDYGVEELIPHPEHHKPDKYKNDIALVRLDRPVETNTYIRPICLPFDAPSARKRHPTHLTMVGYGAVHKAKNDALRELVVPVVGNVKCNKSYRKYRATVGDKQLCAGGERGRGACAGDAGGPLMSQGRTEEEMTYIVGVVSFGPARCGTTDVADVYTLVDAYEEWIKSNMHV